LLVPWLENDTHLCELLHLCQLRRGIPISFLARTRRSRSL
jgi:hypothetical protein